VAQAGSPVQVRDTAPEPVLLEIRLGQVATRTVEAFRAGDEALIPIRQFFDMAAISGTVSASGRAEAMLPGLGALVIDAASDTATLGRRRHPAPEGTLLWHDAELYVSATRLGELLGMPIYVNWAELEVVARDPSQLPVAQQERRGGPPPGPGGARGPGAGRAPPRGGPPGGGRGEGGE